MGRRGPRPDPAQAAKGYPGRRKGKANEAADRAERVAQLLAAAPAGPGADAFEPPMLKDPLFAGALAVWRELAPRLRETHRLQAEARFIFVQLCVYVAEWTSAEIDVATNGYTQSVKTIAGGAMERRRPMVDIRERAFDNVLKLSERFGLTPHDMYSLFKDQALAAQTNPGLFDKPGSAPLPSEPQPEAAPQAGGLVGASARLRSEPPATAH